MSFYVQIEKTGATKARIEGESNESWFIYTKAGVYVKFTADLIPGIAFVVLNTPNDFMTVFNRYPDVIPTVSLI